MRREYLAARARLHQVLQAAGPEHVEHVMHPDDTLRMLGFINAWLSVLNRVTAVCRTISVDGCEARDGLRSWLR